MLEREVIILDDNILCYEAEHSARHFQTYKVKKAVPYPQNSVAYVIFQEVFFLCVNCLEELTLKV